MMTALMLAATLCAGGQSEYAIVAGTSEVEKVAADEIREIVERSTGAVLPVFVSGAAVHPNNHKGRTIFIGYTPEAEKSFGKDTLRENEYAVTEKKPKFGFVGGGDIWIRGRGWQGTALAAYAFLEDVLGYRMFTPEEGGEKIVKADRVDTKGYSMRRTAHFPFDARHDDLPPLTSEEERNRICSAAAGLGGRRLARPGNATRRASLKRNGT